MDEIKSNKIALTHADPAPEVSDPKRREMMQRLGKFALYAAPFTVLAFTQKAAAAGSCKSGFCGGGGPSPSAKH
jgi:hypothetical protein